MKTSSSLNARPVSQPKPKRTRKTPVRNRAFAPLATSVATLIAGVSLLSNSHAATYTWANTSGNWSNGSWTPSGTPGAADTVMLSTTGTVNVDSSQSILNITTYGAASGNTGSVTGSGTLGLANSGTIYAVGGGAYGISLSAPMSLSGSNYTFRSEGGSGFAVTAAGSITGGYAGLTTLNIAGASNSAIAINSNVSDGAAAGNGGLRLVVNNTSGLTLAGTNTFTGGIVFNGGATLKLSNNQSLGSGTLTINAAGMKVDTGVNPFTNAQTTPQAWNADFVVGAYYAMNFGAGAITLGGNRTVAVSSANAVTYGGAIGDSGNNYGVTFGEVVSTGPSATSSIILTASNTYTGATAVNEGTVTLGGAAGALSSGQVTLNANATLKWDNTTANLSNRLVGTGTLTLNGGYFNNSAIYLSGTSTPSSINLGNLVLGGSATSYAANTYAGSGGTATVILNSLTRNAGSTLQTNFSYDNGAQGRIVLTNSATTVGGILAWGFDTNHSSFVTQATISGTNYLGALGSVAGTTIGTFGANASTDNVKLSGVANPATLLVSNTLNSLNISTSGSLNSINLGGNSLVVNSGGLAATGANGLNIQNGTITTGSQELIYHALSTTSGTISANITDNGSAVSFVKGDGQALALAGSNSYTGTTIVAGGSLTVSGIVANGPIYVNYSGNGTGSGSLTVSGTTGNGLITVGKGTSLTVSATGRTGNGGLTLSPGDGTQNATTTIAGTVGNGTISVGNGDTLTVASTGVVNGPIVFGSNNYNAATLSVASGATLNGAVTSGTNVANTNITQTGAGLVSVPIGSGTNYFGTVTPVASGTLTLNTQAGGVNTIATLTGTTNSVVNLQGSGSNTINSTLNTAGQTISFNGGTWTLPGAGAYGASLVINGANVYTGTGNQNFYSLASLTVNSGTLNILTNYGMRMGGSFGAQSGSPNNFTGSQIGGTINFSGGSMNNGFELGSSAGTNSASYSLSGGVLNTVTLDLGANATSGGQTTFSLSGGKVLASSLIQGAQGTGAKQAFVWTGGVLAANAYNASNLVSATGVAVAATTNTLTNAGGTLAPGDIGRSGLTTVTGNYSQSSGTLAIDLGGTTASGQFQDTGLGKFDKLAITGSASLAGNLSINILPGYAPSTNSFAVLTSSTLSASSGAGAFQAGTPQLVQTNEGFSSMTATTFTSGSVVLSNYTITNQWQGGGGNWGTGTTANWTGAIDPNGTTQGAYFGASAAGGTVTLDGTGRIVGTLVFNNAANSYTLAGSSTLTLQGNAGLTKLGTGTLVLGGTSTNSGAMTINAGTVQLSGSGTATTNPLGVGTVAVNSGGTLDLAGYTLANAKALTLNAGALTNSGGAATYSGTATIGVAGATIGGSGNLTLTAALGAGANQFIKNGTGTLTLSVNSTDTGGARLSNGTLRLTAATALGTSASPITLDSGTLSIGNNSAVSLGSTSVYNPSMIVIDAGSSFQIGAVNNNTNTVTITGGGNFTQGNVWGNGAATGGILLDSGFTGIATFNQANTFTGGLTVKSGSAAGTSYPNAFGANTSVITLGDTSGSANATLLGDGRTFANPITVQAGSSGTLGIVGTGGATTATFSGAISGSGALTTSGYVTLSSASSTYTGNLTVASGTLKVGGSTAPYNPNLVTVANGAVLDLNAANEVVNGLSGASGATVTNSGAAKTLTLVGSGTYSYGGAITATTPANLALTVALGSGGIQTLSGVNSYTGATTLTSGKLNINSATALGAAASALTVNGGTIDNTSGGALTLSSTSTITIGGDFLAFSSSSTSTSNLNLGSGPVAMNLNTAISGGMNRTITLNGTGTTLTLSGTLTPTTSYYNTVVNVNGAGNTLSLGGLMIQPSSSGANPREMIIGGNANVTVTSVVTCGVSGTNSSLYYAGSGTFTMGGSTQSPVTPVYTDGVFSGTWKLDESGMVSQQNIVLPTQSFNLLGGGLTVFGGSQTFATLTASNAGGAITLDEGAGTAANLTVTTFTRNAGSTTRIRTQVFWAGWHGFCRRKTEPFWRTSAAV